MGLHHAHKEEASRARSGAAGLDLGFLLYCSLRLDREVEIGLADG